MLKYLENIETTASLSVQKVSRRAFLGAGSAFALAVYAAPSQAFPTWAVGGDQMPNGLRDDQLIFVSIDADGTVTLVDLKMA